MLCAHPLETHHHILLTYPYYKAVRFALPYNTHLHNIYHLSTKAFIQFWYASPPNSCQHIPLSLWSIIGPTTYWNIWKEICQAIFNKTKPKPLPLLAKLVTSSILDIAQAYPQISSPIPPSISTHNPYQN